MLFCCTAIAAMTGTDFWPRFAGYRTRRQALVTIARIAPSLGEAVGRVLDVPPNSPRSALRGDVVLFRDDIGEDHLGLCVGAYVAVLGPSGLLRVPITDERLLGAWRVC